MVYVDTGAGVGAMDADFQDVEKPLPSPEELAANENLDGLSEQQLATFRRARSSTTGWRAARVSER